MKKGRALRIVATLRLMIFFIERPNGQSEKGFSDSSDSPSPPSRRVMWAGGLAPRYARWQPARPQMQHLAPALRGVFTSCPVGRVGANDRPGAPVRKCAPLSPSAAAGPGSAGVGLWRLSLSGSAPRFSRPVPQRRKRPRRCGPVATACLAPANDRLREPALGAAASLFSLAGVASPAPPERGGAPRCPPFVALRGSALLPFAGASICTAGAVWWRAVDCAAAPP